MSKPPYRSPRSPDDKPGDEYQLLGPSETIDTFEFWAWVGFGVGLVVIYVFFS